ncbi:electron transport complex subunit RsxE [Limnochorda pilosa]|uniref:Electron transporter RsxE n=1 Tax=Limnochorda pilosa TaxID=1555112 RepID=A0A0K2SR06_LIMPI|nr:electron transport complex subunit RsxE [Limnochorda pilosa]BAS29244.1 electron transporter RsxE [Limnochorda pilosa]
MAREPRARWSELKGILSQGLYKQTPPFFLVIGLCPSLAVTTGVLYGAVMGIAVTFVLLGSNVIVSAVRRSVPRTIRIPVYTIVIATLVTVVDLVLAGTMPPVHRILGLFVPLIVVNCIILGRVEGFGSHVSPGRAAADAIGFGLGYTWALVAISSIREILGSGTWFSFQVLPAAAPTVGLFKLAPGAFITMAALLAMLNLLRRGGGTPARREAQPIPAVSRNLAS